MGTGKESPPWPPSCMTTGVAGPIQVFRLRSLGVSLALATLCPVPALAAKNSPPAQVIMLATMPPTFSLQAAQASVSGASGDVQSLAQAHGRLLIRGQLHGHGGRAVVRIPLSLAANTRSFVVQAGGESASHVTVSLSAPELMARRMPLRGQASLAMGLARNHGREFFTLNQPLHSILEIIFEHIPSGQTRNFSLALSMRDLGY